MRIHRYGRPVEVAGLSMVELFVALAILAVSITSIFGSFSAGKEQAVRLDALFTGRMLGQSILEQVLHRSHVQDNRYFNLETSATQLLTATVRGDWQKPFLALAQPRTPVITPPGQPNPYFDPVTGPPVPEGLAGSDEKNLWGSFSYEVRVGFTTAVLKDSPVVPLDADGDGTREADLAQLQVEVFYQPLDHSQPERSVCLITTLLHAPDKSPGAGAFSTF
jgi:type II secretory pathway pseudopilin PulG